MKLFSKSKKFEAPLNTAVYTTKHVMNENSLITLVSHELDGAWQFMGSEPINDYREIAMLVSLGEIIKKDKSILEVSDLAKGYLATRKNKKDKWEIIKIEYSEEEIKEMGFFCSSCGEFHSNIPMAYGSDAPYKYSQIPESELDKRCELNEDLCIIDQKEFYIKGNLLIPVEGKEEFSWNVWTQISESDFKKMEDLWEDENRVLETAYSGLLATKIDVYPETLNLPVKVHTQKVGTRPKIEVSESSHPLFLEQENGINMERVIAFAKQIMHEH